jgi:hypothetical protein
MLSAPIFGSRWDLPGLSGTFRLRSSQPAARVDGDARCAGSQLSEHHQAPKHASRCLAPSANAAWGDYSALPGMPGSLPFGQEQTDPTACDFSSGHEPVAVVHCLPAFLNFITRSLGGGPPNGLSSVFRCGGGPPNGRSLSSAARTTATEAPIATAATNATMGRNHLIACALCRDWDPHCRTQ